MSGSNGNGNGNLPEQPTIAEIADQDPTPLPSVDAQMVDAFKRVVADLSQIIALDGTVPKERPDPTYRRMVGYATRARDLLSPLATKLAEAGRAIWALNHSKWCVQHAEQLVRENRDQARRIAEDAGAKAGQIVADAKAKAEDESARLLESAGREAERIVKQARLDAEAIVAGFRDMTEKASRDHLAAQEKLKQARQELRDRIAENRRTTDMLDRHIARKLALKRRIEAECVRLEAVAAIMAERMAEDAKVIG